MTSDQPQAVQTLWSIIMTTGPEPAPEMLFVSVADPQDARDRTVLAYVQLDLLPPEPRCQVEAVVEEKRVGKGMTLPCGHFLGLTKAGEGWLFAEGITFAQFLLNHTETCSGMDDHVVAAAWQEKP